MSTRLDGPLDKAAFEKAEKIADDIIEDIIANRVKDERSLIARLEKYRGQVLYFVRLWLLEKLISRPPKDQHYVAEELKGVISKIILTAGTGPECSDDIQLDLRWCLWSMSDQLENRSVFFHLRDQYDQLSDRRLEGYMTQETYMELMDYAARKELFKVLAHLSTWDQWKVVSEKQVHAILKLMGPKLNMCDTQMEMLSNLDVGSLQKLREIDARKSDGDKLMIYKKEEAMARPVEWRQIVEMAKQKRDQVSQPSQASRQQENFYGEPKTKPKRSYEQEEEGEYDSDEDNQLDKIKVSTIEEHLRPGTATTHGEVRRKLSNSSKVYKWTSGPGRVLIINNKHFRHDFDGTMRRDGSDIDVTRVKDTLKPFGFEITVETDLDADEMTNEIRKFVEHPKHKSSSCAMIFIMTHGGDHGLLLGSDRKSVSIVNDIKPLFANTDKTKALRGKAVVLVVQSCRGSRTSIRSPSSYETDTMDSPAADASRYDPMFLELLALHSSADGYSSVRNPKYGSPFIYAICETLNEKTITNNYELMQIIGLAQSILDQFRDWVRKKGKISGPVVQTIEYVSTGFNKKFYFPELY